MSLLPVEKEVDGLADFLVIDLAVQVFIDYLGPLFRGDVTQQVGAQIAGHRHIITRPGITGCIDQAGIQAQNHMALDLTRLDLICIYIVPVEQVDGLGHHFHVTQFLRCNIQKQVLDFLLLDAKALGHILHGGL